MSIGGRIWKAVTAVGGATTAPIGLAIDLAKAPFTDDEYGGVTDTLFRSTLKHGGQFAGNLIGPEGVGGQVIGALPRPIRQAGDTGLNALEAVYREGISEPITAAITAGSLSDAPGGGGLAGLFRREHWREGYRIAQDRSPGQALAIAAGTKDIRNQAEVNKFAASTTYDVMSATADAVLRLTADPTVIVGKVAGAARLKHLVRPIRTADDIDKAMDSVRVAKFIDKVDELVDLHGNAAPAMVRDQFFPGDAFGAVVSTVLSEAPDTVTRRQTLRALMGDRNAFAELRQAHAPTAARVDRLMAERSSLLQYDDGTLFADPDRLSLLTEELGSLYPAQRRAERLQRAVERDAVVRQVPKAPTWGIGPVELPAANTIRTTFTRSDFYQDNPLAAPIRATFNMVPHRFINLHAGDGDVQVARLLRQSPVGVETQDELRSLYMAATNPGERQVALEKITEKVMRAFADESGLSRGDLNELLARSKDGRARAHQVLNSRAYDGKGRSAVTFVDDDGLTHQINLPLFVTQEQNFHVMPDLDRLRQATTKIGRWKARHPKSEIPNSLMESFDHVWRTSVLLRPAWPIRVVGDEQLRILAKIGAAAQLKYLSEIPGAVADEGKRAAAKVGMAAGLVDEMPTPRLRIGERPFDYRGYDLEAAFGAPGDANNQFRQLNSARSSWQALSGIDADEADLLTHLRQRSGDFKTKAPDAANYGPDWQRAVNLQFGKDPIGRKLLAGESVDDVVLWLNTSDEGRALAQRFSFRAGSDPRPWVDAMAETIDDYTLNDPGLKALALDQKATIDDLIRIAPDANDRPMIHGEIVNQLTGTAIWRDTLRGVIDKSFDVLGTQPTDVLSRNPFFDATYQAEMRRLIDLWESQDGARITGAQLRGLENKARQYALRESKDLLYDLAEQSRLAQVLRFYVPFYSAFAEVTTRWAGLAVENPAFLARARMVWNSPEKAGVVTDENGSIIDDKGNARFWLTGAKTEAGAERFINMQLLPEQARDLLRSIPGAKRLADSKYNKVGFNLALSGAPGFGPIVQLPVNQLVVDRPDLEDAVSWALPMGSTPSIRDLLLSSGVKKAWTAAEGEDSRAFVNSRNSIYDAKRVEFLLGQRDTAPTWEEATNEAKTFWKMRTVASFISPVAPGFSSPYQPYIDAYRNAQTRLRDNPAALADSQGNQRSADEWFLDTFSTEFFPLTESLSRSNDGIAPTTEGFKARKKYQALVEAHPELGGLIIGNEGAGEFAGAVYSYQLTHALRPGSGDKQRETPSFEEHQAGPDVRYGWLKYRRFMDLLDAARVQRGLPNLQVAAARDLAALRTAFIVNLTATNEAWAAEFGNTDRNAWERKLDGLRAIAESDAFADRPDRQDIVGLRDYLRLRGLLLGELAKRPASTLTASSNMDLAFLWETLKADLVERNLAFGSLFHRWLTSDPMTLDTQEEVAA